MEAGLRVPGEANRSSKEPLDLKQFYGIHHSKGVRLPECINKISWQKWFDDVHFNCCRLCWRKTWMSSEDLLMVPEESLRDLKITGQVSKCDTLSFDYFHYIIFIVVKQPRACAETLFHTQQFRTSYTLQTWEEATFGRSIEIFGERWCSLCLWHGTNCSSASITQ